MGNSVRWDGHVWRREDGVVLRMALDFLVEGHRKKSRPRWTCEKQVDEERMNAG